MSLRAAQIILQFRQAMNETLSTTNRLAAIEHTSENSEE
jgi:hypothetical protein